MSETLETLEAVCRVWKSGNKTPILIFPKEINPHKYTVELNMTIDTALLAVNHFIIA